MNLGAISRSTVAICALTTAFALQGAPAFASTLQATCGSFGTQLAAAGSGDTIVLSGMCTGAEASFTLPAKTGLTIEGAASGVNGFDGTSVGAPALTGTVDGLTLQNLTFKNYSHSSAVRVTSTDTATSAFVFSGDIFTNDSAPAGGTGDGGGLFISVIESAVSGACGFSGPAVTLTGSTFSGDRAAGGGSLEQGSAGGGGGALIDIECRSGSPTATVTNNRFTDDQVSTAAGRAALGGGLFIGTGGYSFAAKQIAVTQSGNVFSSNIATAGSGAEQAGGGEFTAGVNLMSVADGFFTNSLPGPNASTGASEGAGLASEGAGNCSSPSGDTSQATNLVAAGNTIGAPTGTGAASNEEGAGVYVGCSFGGGGYHMTLINSTIAGNAASGSGAVAGIDGESTDFLALKNSIVFGNSSGKQLAGFGATDGANVTATYSDLCDLGSPSSPFTGTGNICADPQLVDPVHGNVHETATSPTLDDAFNGDVPGGVTTDYYGLPRIQLGKVGDAALVDMGAAEFHPASPHISDCSQLQALLNQAQPGDVITLSGICTGGSFDTGSTPGVTLQGAPTGTNGFDGTGATHPALRGYGNGLTLRNLVVRNYSLTGEPAVDLFPSGPMPTIDHDEFENNSTTGISVAGAGLFIQGGSCSSTGSASITNSTFSDNTLTSTSASASSFAVGAGAAVLFFCDAVESPHVSLTGNTFTGNSIHTGAAGAYGGGLYFANGGVGHIIGTQARNTFRSNSILATGTPSGSYNGAGEWVGSVELTSTGDMFAKNSLPGPAGASAASEGAGIGLIRGNCGPPSGEISADLIDLVSAGNSIGAPSSGGSSEGAGVYAGCAAEQGTAGFHLTLTDSTVSGNAAPGGVAGVDGEGGDSLILRNSIVFGDTGTGSHELGGFGIGGGSGSIVASFSDACSVAAATPLAGTGNMCADPKLISASTGDVHESPTSPTIDAGSNTLVAPGLSSDFYAKPRIVATRSCSPAVDIGAAELQTKASPCPPKPAATKLLRGKPSAGGVTLKLACVAPPTTLTGTCAGKVKLTVVETKRGSKVVSVAAAKHRTHKVIVSVGSASYRIGLGKQTSVVVRLNRAGRKLLSRFGKLRVTVVVTQTQGSRTVTVSRRRMTINAPKHRK
jgi:hypothetical protein